MRNFQVGISYAREDINIVKQVRQDLKDENITVFMDYENSDWIAGTSLDIMLREIYLNRCRYCIMFISESYAQKIWTNYEKEILLEKRTSSLPNNPYTDVLIPIRIDDTQLEGFSPHIAYFDIREKSTKEIAQCIVRKISGVQNTQPVTLEYLLDTIGNEANRLLHEQASATFEYELKKISPYDITIHLRKEQHCYFVRLLCEQNTKEKFIKIFEGDHFPHKIPDIYDAEIHLQNNEIHFINYIFSNDVPAVPHSYTVEQVSTLIMNKINIFLKEYQYV